MIAKNAVAYLLPPLMQKEKFFKRWHVNPCLIKADRQMYHVNFNVGSFEWPKLQNLINAFV
jgi:hypothetical protein